MRQLVLRLSIASAAVAVAAVIVTALITHLVQERSRVRSAAEADLSAMVSLVEATADEESLLRGIARTTAGREGRLAVHLGDVTVGTSRLAQPVNALPVDALPPGATPDSSVEVAVEGGAGGGDAGSVLVRLVDDAAAGAGAGPVLVEVFVPAAGIGGPTWGWAALLLAAGAVGTAAAAAAAVRGLRPAVDDLTALIASARRIGDDDRPLRTRSMHTPEAVAMAAALDGLADRFSAARDSERRLAADLSHRLRTPLTALRLDVSSIGDSVAADRVRHTVDSLNDDIDVLITAPVTRETGPVRCDVVEVVRRRMGFWTALAQHNGRSCEVVTVDPPALTALAGDDLAAVVDAMMTNIFRYTPEGTGFAVAVVRHAGWITLVVDDAGPGVVDPVSALSRGVSSSGSTGLGLDIARDAVEATGGTIHIERAALGGARIRLRFGEVGAEHTDPDEPRAWRLWGSARRRKVS